MATGIVENNEGKIFLQVTQLENKKLAMKKERYL